MTRTDSERKRAVPPDVPAAPAPGPAADPAPGSVAAVLGDLVRSQLDALLALDGAVRRDEPDSVHQMRVAARRLRGTLRTHRRSRNLHAEETNFAAIAQPLRNARGWFRGESTKCVPHASHLFRRRN